MMIARAFETETYRCKCKKRIDILNRQNLEREKETEKLLNLHSSHPKIVLKEATCGKQEKVEIKRRSESYGMSRPPSLGQQV